MNRSLFVLLALGLLPACDFQKALDDCIAQGGCMAATPTARPISPEPGAPTGNVGGVPSQVMFKWKVDGMTADASFTYMFEYVECNGHESLSDCWWRDNATLLTGSGTILYLDPPPSLLGHRVAWRVRACDASQTPAPCGPWSAPSWVKLGHPSGPWRNNFGANDPQLVVGQVDPLVPSSGEVETYWNSGGGVGWSGAYASDTGVNQFGRSVEGAGDVNGDGIGDLVVGASGHAYLAKGGTNGIPQAGPAVEIGSGTDGYGAIVARAGDIDGDGFSDVIVSEGSISPPVVHLYRGGATGLTYAADFRIEGGGYSGIPSSIKTIGDLGGFGTDAFAIAEPGYVHLVAGQQTVNPGIYRQTRTLSAGSAAVVAGLGDTDGDGLDDFAVADGANAIKVYFGNMRLLYDDLYAPRTVTLTDPDATEIRGLAALGDVDGNGYPDFVAQLDSNKVRIYYASPAGFTAGTLLTAPGPITALAGVNDVDRNGVPDFAVGIASMNKVVLYRLPASGQAMTTQVIDGSIDNGLGYSIASAF